MTRYKTTRAGAVAGGAAGVPDVVPRLAVLPVLAVAGAVLAVLAVMSGRYGYHRDELYFLACARHLAWGYPDQPPLVPWLARAMSNVSATSVGVLRIPSDLAAAGTVVLTAAIARELRADRAGQILAASVIGASNLLLATGHLLSTTTFLLTSWAGMTLIALRALRTGDGRWWLAFGLVTGLGLLDSDLVAFLAVAIVVAALVFGPRRSLASPWALGGAVLAGALWSPYLVWQAVHHWPQLTVARAIANGQSGTSAPRWQVVVMQFVLCSPPLVPIWVAGLVRLLRERRIRWARPLGVSYFLLLAAFVATAGKPYYLAALFPLLVGAGVAPTVRWARKVGSTMRWPAIGAAVVLSAAIDAVVTLPIVPVSDLHATPIVAMNYDVGETVAWPRYVSEIAAAYRSVPAGDRGRTVILTRNYGEAGAVDRYGPSLGVPGAFSGHNAYWLWGPPPADVTTVIAVGLRPDVLTQMFSSVMLVGRLDNGLSVHDDEQGVPLWLAHGPTGPWPRMWPQLKRYR